MNKNRLHKAVVVLFHSHGFSSCSGAHGDSCWIYCACFVLEVCITVTKYLPFIFSVYGFKVMPVSKGQSVPFR